MVGGGQNPPLKKTEIINLAATTPKWKRTGDMNFARRHCNGVLLPDGTVLAVGGTSGNGTNNAKGRVLVAERWNPATGIWSPLASMTVPRLYHSTALLLPDARVLVAGGGKARAASTTTRRSTRRHTCSAVPGLRSPRLPTASATARR